jgi:hypothetical protein
MSSNSTSKKEEDLVVIYKMALGLEKRFPGNNGAFAYGTRLCEEVGELVEVLNNIHSTHLAPEKKHHFIKESEDVLQIVQGVLGIYKLNHRLPYQLEAFFADQLLLPTKDSIIALSIAAGAFADTINHIESQGIKQMKHGNNAEDRLVKAASQLTEHVARFVQSYDVLEEFEAQIQKDYDFLRSEGNITE